MSNTQLVELLSKFLANTYTLYLKTQNYHWNVTGPLFPSLHLLFEGQYTQLALQVDEIAERIRALGAVAPGSYSQFTQLSTVKEAPHAVPKALDMVKDLETGHELMSKQAHEIIEIATHLKDDVTVDMCVVQKGMHEKTAWMLRSVLE